MPKFDGERLAKQTYLTTAEAAQYLGYTDEAYKYPSRAFHSLVVRRGLPRFYTGRRLLFARKDLDRFVSGGITGRRRREHGGEGGE